MKLNGIGASSGVAIAKVFELEEAHVEIVKSKATPADEIKKLDKAIAKTVTDIEAVKAKAIENIGPEEGAIFDAHIQVATDPMMLDEIKALINEEEINAIYASSTISKKYVEMFENMDDEYMKERAADIKDVSKRLINNLAGVETGNISSIDEEVIVVANDLTPSDTAQLNKKFAKGFATNIGGRTSHSAIMARSLEIPAVLGLGTISEEVKTGDIIAMNGDTGEVIINPTDKEIEAFKAESENLLKETAEAQKFKGKESKTNDGHEVEIAANIGSIVDLKGVLENDAEGVGLFRSEFLYMDAKDWPTEEEQFTAYSEVIKGMNNKKVVIRTLDIGGDKTLEYFEFPKEMNPFLGYRAIRLSLDKPEMFRTQLRALIRASEFGKLAIMFPMIATIDEFLNAKKIYTEEFEKLKKTNSKISDEIEVGMMVEVPAAAAIAKQFAKHSDFFSIGTNDLMQYTMAADRMSEKVSYLYQPLNPSILNLIKMTIDGAHSEGKWVGMCGEMAGDKNAVPVLLGLGLDEFSVSASSVLKVRKQISEISFKEAQALSLKAIESSTEAEVQALVSKFNK